MNTDNTSARAAASLLIARKTAGHAPDDVQPVKDALRATLLELSRWLGPGGCRALLERALNRAGQEHPVLGELAVISKSAPTIELVDDAVQAHGSKVVVAGLTTTLVQLFELLERVIGNDLTLTLAERITDGPSSETTGDEVK
jgi:hypothetical protein